MVTAALFTIAKLWRQPTPPISRQLGEEGAVHMHNGISLSHIENEILHLQQHGWTWRVLC